MDVDAIQPGRDFRKAIHENVGGCSIFLAVIGPDWLDVKSTVGSRRLDSENDYVRLEIATALRRDIPVVPVLVRGARMPKSDQLPEEIRDLAYRNSVELTHARWKSDVQVLGQALAPYLGNATDSPAAGIVHVAAAPEAHAAPASSEVSTGLDGAAITRVSHELAQYIGPIAELVVKRAAKRCASLQDLCTMVSEEIDASSDRARFLASCRR